ncbi:TIR domain-containing protein [Flavobacteriaceae bacterium TP-CH-4]|uniref:TIR domain-containing protein n=1 Tax=Pelagihabitans pacificus TaxID=2696054 RepID=A0A967E788_9FLAO|nr:TIR domain-containing protein [Pelagihabitans pacificus]NHF59989.1 TIR domain-containing protein [Pelagihabitans pacificus]
MNKWADYLVSKEKWIPNVKRIESFYVHHDNGDTISSGFEKERSWIVQQINNGKTFSCITKNSNGVWIQKSSLTLTNKGGLNWSDNLPLILPRRKAFISYYHKDDKEYKKRFYKLTSDLIINKSVEDGDIKSDNGADYVKQLINKGYLSDTTILIVLIGPKTKCRKHIDWEISGALNYKVGNSYAGLLGLKLPGHPDYNTGKFSHTLQPQRLTDNLKTKYALIRDYTTNRRELQNYIELAYEKRKSMFYKRDNSRLQMKINTCS